MNRYMIKKDKTKNRTIGGTPLSNKSNILRHETTKNILCVLCLVDIASINPDD